MSKKIIYVGLQSNDGTGDSIRDAFQKANDNFDELYSIAGAGSGLFFTKSLVDTPKTLTADTITNASSIIGVNHIGNSLTNKIMYAGTGMQIISTGSSIYIINTSSNLYSDPNPKLSNDLNGNDFKAFGFADPTENQDLATKNYVDNNSFASSVNLYVSTSGVDGRTGIRAGRALAYAFRTINYACQVAEELTNQSNIELGPDQKYITYGLDFENQSLIQTITTSTQVPGNVVLNVDYTGDGTDPWIQGDIRPGQYLKGMTSGAVGFIDYLTNVGNAGSPKYESYDVRVLTATPFRVGEALMYGNPVPVSNITIMVESGIYEEQYPIKVPPNVSIRGDEFRRVIVRPANGASSSTWVRTYFCRDTEFDGLSIASQRFGYHYLTDPNDVNSTPKQNDDLDVFMMNDQTILRALSCQGHGGFMVVLDPEGQILTKSPYMQNCSSISKSINTQTFAGGMYIDGCVGNLQATPVDTTTYFTGTLTVSVTGLTFRQPQVPCAIIDNGIRYEVDYVEGWTATTGAAILHLNPLTYGGIGAAGGVIPVNAGTGYSSAPTIQFSPPTELGGIVAQATATIAAGVVTQLNITNPGSGYRTAPTVTFTGGGYATPATLTLSNNIVTKGFVGVLPSTIELGTAGYRSALAADFTQLNDLGYGIVVTNIAFSELVSVFTYFCHVGYYTANGGQIGSSNGAIKYGDYALKADGRDQFEVPIPIRLMHDMITTATVLNSVSGYGINTVNTTSDTTLYIANWSAVPNSQSFLEVDYGAAVDANGKLIGRQTYTISSAAVVGGYPSIVQLSLSTAGGALGSLKGPITDGTSVIIRANKSFTFSGIDATTISRPSTALDFTEAADISYHVLTYDTSITTGTSDITIKEPYSYIQITPWAYTLPGAGATTLHINSPSTSTGVATNISDSQRLINAIASGNEYIFGWGSKIHQITGFTWQGSTSTITITPALSTAVNTSTVTLYAGLQANNAAEIYTRISLLRATGQDLVSVGAGGRETANIPNDIYGPPRKTPDSAYEIVEVGQGRVFHTSTDQDGNFRVGSLFSINQGTGAATLDAAITLTGIEGLGFSRGVTVDEFSNDFVMNPATSHIVPTQFAVSRHVSAVLGLNDQGAVVGKIGPGYLDLTGVQKMEGTLQTGGWSIDMGQFYSGSTSKVYNLSTCTSNLDAANKIYVDTNDALKVAKAGDTMSGALILSADPIITDPALQATTRRYVDQIRQLSTLSDVTLTSPLNADLLMFSSTTLSINTTSSRPIWDATRQIINVTNSTTSNISITREGNSAAFTINTNTITNAMINSGAAIAQSKLALTAATTRANATGITQANLGSVSLDSAFFATTNGWATFAATASPSQVLVSNGSNVVSWQPYSTVAPTNITGNAATATKLATARNINGVAFDGTAAISVNLNNALTAGSYLTSGGTFDGSAARTFAVDATTSTTASKVVARDVNGSIWGNYFIGVATSALYADLAEKYLADEDYAPGTVVVFGGEQEVTQSTKYMDVRVAGVVSTNPAYLMNSGASGLPIALQGRVPCRVIGKVSKGDMLVTSPTPGVAISAYSPMMGSVIGKALGLWDSEEVGVIEIVVGRL